MRAKPHVVKCYNTGMNGKIVAINTSLKKGERKKSVRSAVLRENYGVEGDAHASSEWHRQVSMLAMESIRKMQAAGLDVDCGDFAENLTTEGIELFTLPVGTKMTLGRGIEVEITQIGKECHNRCNIYYQAGDCVMPKEGIFVKVLKGGTLAPGDDIILPHPLTPSPSGEGAGGEAGEGAGGEAR